MEEQFDGIMEEAYPSSGNLDPFGLIVENTGDIRNSMRTLERKSQITEDPAGMQMGNFTASDLRNTSGAQGFTSFYKEAPSYNRIRSASDNAINTGKILGPDGKTYEDFDKNHWNQSSLSFLGYNNFLYERPVKYSGNDLLDAVEVVEDHANNIHLDSHLVSGYLRKFDENQQYEFLVPTIDHNTGREILQRVVDTYKGATEKGYNVLNEYGASDDSDGLLLSFGKGAGNTLLQTDDLLVGFAKYIQDGALYLTGNSDVETQLDDVYEDIATDTHRTQFISSDQSSDFMSADWWGQGAGAAMGSLLQFGGVGRGIRGATYLASLGKLGAKSAVAGKIATYGSSGVIGFGYGYKEAIDNGLTDGDALLYGTFVGGLNTLIESKLGKSFDNFITGGGPKAVAKEVLRSMDGEVSEQGFKRFMQGAGQYISGLGNKFSNMAPEAAEEMLQDVVEQGSKLTYNALLADDDAKISEGKFDIEEFDFMSTVSAGIFGGLAAAPFNTQTRTMSNRIMEGEGAKVDSAIESLYTDGKITERDYNTLKSKKRVIQDQYDINKVMVDDLGGEFAPIMKDEVMQLLVKRHILETAAKDVYNGLKDLTQEDAAKAKAQKEGMDAAIADLSAKISNYKNREWVKARAKEIKERKDSAVENSNSPVGRAAAATYQKTDSSIEETKKRITTADPKIYTQTPIARNSAEAANVTQLIGTPAVPQELMPQVAKQFRSYGYQLSKAVNTDENRENLLALGFAPEELAMTAKEKIDAVANPQAYLTRVATPAFGALVEATPGQRSIDKYKAIFAGPDAGGLNPSQIASLDNSEQLASMLSDKQLAAITKLRDTALPTSIMLLDEDAPTTGFYSQYHKILFVSGRMSRPEAREEIFHVLTHELGHGLFNRELNSYHDAWMKSVGGQKLNKRQAAMAAYFDQAYRLATLAQKALKDRPEFKTMYFNEITATHAAITDAISARMDAGTVVKEFFSEALSNAKFQAMLDSIDLTKAEYAELAKQLGYQVGNKFVQSKSTLLGEVYKLLSSVFQSIKNILNREDRTLLTESAGLMNNVQFNRFYTPEDEAAQNVKSQSLGISNYGGINLFDGEAIDGDQLQALLYRRLEKAGVRLNDVQQKQLLYKVSDFMKNEVYATGKQVLGGSMQAVYFKSSDNFMIMWKEVGETSDRINRAFFNKYGNRVHINTNVTNHDSPMTIAKYNIMEAFKPGYAGQEAEHKRRVLNNIERARAEGFAGEAFLDLDGAHTWILDNKVIQGQIRVMYKFSDGSIDMIGSVPDLAKARLATILAAGTEVKVKVSTDGPGSSAYVRRNQNGKLTQVYPTNDNTIDKSKYSLEQVSGKLKFNYVSSTINAQISDLADSVDMVTADYNYTAPDLSQDALSSGLDILTRGYYPQDYMAGISLYDSNPEGVNSEPGTVDHRIQFVRDGLSRNIRRALHFTAGKVTQDDLYKMAANYNDRSTAYLIKAIPTIDPEQAKQLGFASREEFAQYAMQVIEDITTEHRSEGNINKEDWSGMGGNPSGRISAGVKSDIESINFTHESKKHWIDFSEGKDILFDAAEDTHSFDAMIDRLEDLIKAKHYGGRRLAMAEAILKHWQTQNEVGGGTWNEAKNSYWSQPASYVRLDAITVAPSGDSAFLFFNGESSYIKGRSDEYAAKVQLKINKIKDQAIAQGVTSAKDIGSMVKTEMNNHLATYLAQRAQRQGKSAQSGVDRANSILSNQDGSISNVVNKLLSFRSNYETGKFNMKGYSHTGVMVGGIDRMVKLLGIEKPNSGKGLADYSAMSDMIAAYLDFFGMEPAENLFDIKADGRTQKYVVEYRKEQIAAGRTVDQANADARQKLDELPLNIYQTVLVPAKDGKNSEVPFVRFGLDFVNYLQQQVDKQIAGSEYSYAIGEMKTMVKTLIQSEGSYRSPEFYFNANFEKEWALKLKSYTDTLVKDLSKKDSIVMDQYLSKDIYKDNRFLKSIKHAAGRPVQFMLSGIRSVDGTNVSQSYNTSGELDYMFTNLAGYTHNYGSEFYYHVDDVPSDKPRNMAYLMTRIPKGGLKAEVQNILNSEKERMDRRKAKGEKVFNIENTFYGGKSAGEIVSQIQSEGLASYENLRRQGMTFPVTPQFIKELNERALPKEAHDLELRAEQQRLFLEWRENFIINRYHLSMVLMGDYMHYKQDEFVDLNKRNAGTKAPSQKGVFGPSIKVALLNDVEVAEGEVSLPVIHEDENGKQTVEHNANDISGKVARTDAQGYVTDRFAEKIEKAYGSFAGYEKIFKPVVFGVNKADLAEAKPLYLKLSMAVLPNPENNPEYYAQNPGQLSLATKLYASGADFLTFKSAVKVGGGNFNHIDDDKYNTISVDSDLFGLQNNPYHDPNDDENFINGMVQFFKMLGDNGSSDQALAYHKIESALAEIESDTFMHERLSSGEKIREFVKEQLAANEYSSPIADFVDAEVNVLDNPITSRFAENMINAGFRKRVGLVKKHGDKLVNVSDLGFQRPSIDENLRRELLQEIGVPFSEYSKELAWLGPRNPGQLTLEQLQEFAADMKKGTASIDGEYNIINSDGSIKIYPAEAIVPKGNYQKGDKILATRIPTSKRSNIIPAVVVGHSHESQGNIIAVGKPGTAILGFDFDVDGLFVWRERGSDKGGDLNQMFHAAFNILTDAKNYNDMTSPTITDQISSIAGEVDNLIAEAGAQKVKYSKFSPERQVELKKLNAIGKDMIGVTANRSGIHSVMEQTGGNAYISTDYTSRGYRNFDGSLMRKFVAESFDENGVATRVTDNYSEFLNAAADNVKLQILGRINANPDTGAVLFDMMSHGIPMRHAVLFINQPIIREFVRLSENKKSVAFSGDRSMNVASKLIEKVEGAIRALGGKYATYEWDKIEGKSSVNPMQIRQFVGGQMVTSDKIKLSLDALQAGISGKMEAKNLSTPEELRFQQLERQLVVLDKFLFYKSLAKISGDAGKAITLTSGYPKTFVELLDTRTKIEKSITGSVINTEDGEVITSPKMESDFLNNPTVALQWQKLNDLIKAYEPNKLYALPEVLTLHQDLAEGKDIKIQQKLHDDFYTALLAKEEESDNANFVYNLSTSSINGTKLDVYKFANQSALLISELKKAMPENEFLRLLKVKLNGTLEQQAVKQSEPSIVTLDLAVEPDGEMIENIRSAFKKLPTNFKFSYMDEVNGVAEMIETTVTSAQDVVLGHLLHTQGFNMGGFGFSKLLPVETAKSFDNAFQAARLDPQLDLQKFSVEAKLNIPELTPLIDDTAIKAATDKGHYMLWSKQKPAGKEWTFPGNGRFARRTKADGGEQVIFQYSKNPKNSNLFNRILESGVIRMKDASGKVRTYVVSDTLVGKVDDKYSYKAVVLDTINFRTFKDLKQYNSIEYSGMSNAALEAGAVARIQEGSTQEEEMLEPQIEQISAEDKQYYLYWLDAGALDVKSGKQIAAPFAPNSEAEIPQIGSIITIQTDQEDAQLLVRVKRVWDGNEMLNRSIARYGEAAPARLIEWASKITNGRVKSLSEILDRKIIDFEFVNEANRQKYDDAGAVIDATISEYSPKQSSGFYKSIMLSAAQKLKSVPTFPYSPETKDIFFDALRGLNFDDLQRQVINDFIENKAIVSGTSDDISNEMDKLATSPDDLENYNTAVGYDRYTQTPLEIFHQVAVESFGTHFEDVAKNFGSVMHNFMSGDETMVNPDTLQPYTYYEWLLRHYGRYKRDEAIIREIEAFYEENVMTDQPVEKLLYDYTYIKQNMGAADGLTFKLHEAFIRKLGAAAGAKAEAKSFDIIAKRTGGDSSFAQQDIKTWAEKITSITDFTERQAAMQEVGRSVQTAAQGSNAEKFRVNATMETLMRDVLKYYYAEKPKSFIDKINIFARGAQSRLPFDWMFEKDEKGEYTGKMIARFEEREEALRKEIFERVPDDNGELKYFRVSNKRVLEHLKSYSSMLTPSERSVVENLERKYNGYKKYKEQIENATHRQRAEMGRDTSLLRNLWVKLEVSQSDSTAFAELKSEAKQFAGTDKGKLADAKIKLYDFLYNTSNELLRETGYYSFTVERGLMPQTSADTVEIFSRYGLAEARKEFLSDNATEIDRLMTDDGLVVGEAPVMSFTNTKKVPYRTLRKKEIFSVNAPTIFAHHFATLIYKKHYDPVVPVMDAVLEHYQMQRRMGGVAMNELEKFINEWANQKIFFQKSDASKSKLGKAVKILSTLTVTQFLGFAPFTSLVNWSVGSYETWKNLMGDYGFTGGSSRMLVGIKRMHGVGFSDFSRMAKDNKFLYHPKALAIMKHYGIETFVDSEIENYGNILGKVQDIALTLQQNSEIMIRGSAFFAEMTDEQWNAFELNEDGSLNVNHNAPDALTVAEWRNRIGSIQGKYDDETKRLYQGDLLLSSIMLFKGWLIDYVRNRVQGQHYDQFGYEREGYYRTGYRLLTGSTETDGEITKNRTRLLEYMKGQKTLTKLEVQNLRKIAADLSMKAMILLIGGIFQEGGGDDREQDLLHRYLAKVNQSVFLLANPLELVEMGKNPFAVIHDVEAAAKLIDAIVTLNGNQAMKAGYQFVPGKQYINGAAWVVDQAEENPVE